MKTPSFVIPLLSILSLTPTIHAQMPVASVTLPTEPAGISYRYFPRQFVQWVGPELPYSMVELDVDDRGPKPLYHAVLTDRATGKRVHYTNQQLEVEIDKAMGAEVHLVPMQFDSPTETGKGATYLLRFATETNTPVTWQFVQGSDITEQGGGMTPIGGPAPVLLYREQAAVAGEGTALKVGSITSTADVWKEISQPPYFVAYHGALSQDVHTLAFLPNTINWKIDPPAAAVAPAAEWTLSTVDGRVIKAQIDSFANGFVALHDTHPLVGTSVTVEARQAPAGWTLERLRYAPAGAKKGEHTLTLTFTTVEGSSSKFEVVAGKKTHLASGELVMSANGSEAWALTQPDWARRPPVVATASQVRALAMTQNAAPEASATH